MTLFLLGAVFGAAAMAGVMFVLLDAPDTPYADDLASIRQHQQTRRELARCQYVDHADRVHQWEWN